MVEAAEDAGGPAGPRLRSAWMVRSTRIPSEKALRLLEPKWRLCSKLGTSATTRPALAMRTLIRVSTSKPSPHSMAPSIGGLAHLEVR